MKLPEKYSWLYDEMAPKALIEAIKHYGVLEHPGKGSNANIISWAHELNVNGYYSDDDIPWCGLFVGLVVKRAGYEIPSKLLSLGALHWLSWGTIIPSDKAMLWDILVFTRSGGGHVGFYVGEDKDNFLVYGGNQSNAVGFAWIAKSRLAGVRRYKWRVGPPLNIRKVYLNSNGVISTNEK